MKKPLMIVMILIFILSITYVIQGSLMHRRVVAEEARFHELQSDYFIQAKSVRDGAETGSDLNKDLVKIANYPSALMHLKLIGIGKILSGIFVLLFGILIALMVMPVRLAELLRKK